MAIEFTGISDVVSLLRGIQKKTENMRPIMYEIGEIISLSASEAIANQTSPFGNKWTPLKASTTRAYALKNSTGGKNLQRYNKLVTNKKPLVDTGALSNIFVKADNTSVTVGTSATSRGYPYPAVHQFGSNKESGRGSGIPARPFLPINKEGQMPEVVQKQIVKYLYEELLK